MDKQNAIAIVGIGLRFPGANDSRQFWHNLCAGSDSIETLSAEELLARGVSRADLANPNYVRRVAGVKDPECFDAGFFSITTREAQFADPQLRVLLEVSQQAIEDSGHVLNGARTGVYIGAADNDHWLTNLGYHADPNAPVTSLGNRVYVKKDYFATQLSHKLNLTGPSISLNSACSTALVAVHEAVTHLLMYDCDFALAGGCEISQGHGYVYEEGGIQSADGFCRAFDAGANGTIFGSGCGIVVLRRYEDAVQDGDHIYAVILATRTNNDGRQKSGFSAPSVPGQVQVIHETLQAAEISADDVSYVETHGTGTLVGDPIEIESLTQVFRRFTARTAFCAIGSVKSNIGHLSIAAGVAGLIKAALALQHQRIPATLHFTRPNPAIDFTSSPFFVNQELREWHTDGRPRIAAVSAFGVGGTNAHALLQQAAPRAASDAARACELLVLSARSPEALAQARNNLVEFARSEPQLPLADVAYTLQIGRTAFARRCAMVCSGSTLGSAVLQDTRWIESMDEVGEAPRIAFVLSGHAANGQGIAHLYRQEAVFRAAFDACAEQVRARAGIDIRTWSSSAAEALSEEQQRYAPLGVFAASYATAKLLHAWGVQPSAVIGAGLGEYAAACLAGVLPLDDCLQVMLASIAARGSAPLSLLEGMAFEPAQLPFAASSSGELLTPEQALNPQYWAGSATREAGRLVDAARTLTRNGIGLFLEVGPGSGLTALLQAAGLRALCTLPHAASSDANEALAQTLGELWVAGVAVDFSALHGSARRNRIPLPTYPFQRKRYWPEAAAKSGTAPAALSRRVVHPLLGQRWMASERVKVFENLVTAVNPPFLQDHRLMDKVLFPGAGYVEMVLAAARLQCGDGPIRLERMHIERTLMLEPDEPRPVQTMIFKEGEEGYGFEITSLTRAGKTDPEGGWQTHARGRFRTWRATQTRLDLDQLRQRLTERFDIEAIYAAFEAVTYGPCFRALTDFWIAPTEALAHVQLPAVAGAEQGYHFHPVLLDACFQTICAFQTHHDGAQATVPVGLANLDVHANIPSSLWIYVQRASQDGAMRILMLDEQGAVIATLERYEQKSLDAAVLDAAEPFEELFYELAWMQQDLPAAPATLEPRRDTLILTDDLTAGRQLAQELIARRGSVVLHDYAADRDVGRVLRALLERSAAADGIDVVMLCVAQQPLAVGELCNVLLETVQAVAGAEVASGAAALAIVTRGCQAVAGGTIRQVAQVGAASLWGMGAALAKEHPDIACLRLDLDADSAFDASAVAEELRSRGKEGMVAHRGTARHVARVKRLAAPGSASRAECFRVALREFGTFDGLCVLPSSRRALAADEVEVEMHSAGLNFKETLITLGMLKTGVEAPGELALGFDGAGKVARIGSGIAHLAVGDSVIIWGNGCLASHLITHHHNVIRFDASTLTPEQAACLPTVFMTAYYALHTSAGIKPGDRVLIHAAAGGVGQAAIQLAQAAGAEIFATASRGKWEFLRRQGVKHIYDSRSQEFLAGIRRDTGGAGIDIVLNSLSGDFITHSFDLLAPGGRFLEIGKLNIWSAEQARRYRPDVSYRAFELGVGEAARVNVLDAWLRPVLDGLQRGELRPLPMRVFQLEEITPAFRWLAAGRNFGKAVIRLHDARRHQASSRIHADRQYLVTGGLGALGLYVAAWLVDKGARDIALLSRREPSAAVAEELARLRAGGARLRVVNCDVADRQSLAEVIATLPQLAGVFHCAGVLDDGILLKQTRARFATVLGPKVTGTQHLHELTLQHPLEQFVCFSSTSALLDGAGQGNYAAANAYLDSFVHYRRGSGRCGLAINWGGWAGGGMAARLLARKQSTGTNHDLIDSQEGIAALNELLAAGSVQAICTRMRGRLAREAGNPLFSELRATVETPTGRQSQFEQMLRTHQHDVPRAMSAFLQQEVGKVTGLAPDEVPEDGDFAESGIDSLMLAELRNNVQKGLSKSIPAAAFFAHPSVAALTRYIVAEHFADEVATQAVPAASSTVVELSRAAQGRRLYCVPGIGDNVFDFNPLAECGLASGICVLSAGASHPSEQSYDIYAVARAHVAALRAQQPKGPYHLVGYSFGGTVAIEMANQLLAQDEEIATLILLDALPSFRHREDVQFRRVAVLLLLDTIADSLGAPVAKLLDFRAAMASYSADEALRRFRGLFAVEIARNAARGFDIEAVLSEFLKRISAEYQAPSRLGGVRIVHVKAMQGLGALAATADSALAYPLRAYGWEQILDNEIVSEQVDCTHVALLRAPQVQAVAGIIARALLSEREEVCV